MAQVIVRLPPALSQLLSCDRHIEVSGHTVGEALDEVVKKEPGLALHLFDDSGALRRLVLCFCNQDNIRGQEGLDRVLVDDDTITILNSVAGG
jgi:molybdopterin converting factor small subunit